jgi:cyanophycinase
MSALPALSLTRLTRIGALGSLLVGLLGAVPAAGPTLANPAEAASKAHNYRARDFDYFVSGDPARPSGGHTVFSLALMGGGGSVDVAFSALARAAGSGHILILRAVADDSYDPSDGKYGESFVSKWAPVVSAETLVFRNRNASYDPRVLAVLRHADGIFIAGGDQGNYVRYWKGTPVQTALNRHVQHDRPIGGSSAGLAILGHYSYTALDGSSLESKLALADPHNSAVTLEDDLFHFRWLERVITDSHFSARCRLGRLLVFVARIQRQRNDQRVLGLGIDENTALLIDATGHARLAAGSVGSVWLVAEPVPATSLTPGHPLTLAEVQVTRVGADSEISMATGGVKQPADRLTFSIDNGVAHADSAVTSILYRDVVPPDER